MTQDSKESVLSRWSRRKLEAEQLTKLQAEPALPEAEGMQPEAVTDTEAKPVLTDADMPDVETLNADSDFSGFMSEGVSDELRNLALRKLFKAPVFNIRDGLDEYDEDYTTFEKLGDIITCDMKHHIEMQEQKLREELAAETEAEAAADAEAHEAETTQAIEDEPDGEQQLDVVAEAEPEVESSRKVENEQ